MLYWIRKYITTRWHVIRTGLKPGYHDPEEILLYGAMKCLVDYIEQHEPWMETCILSGRREQEVLDDIQKEKNSIGQKAMCLRQYEDAKETVAIYRWWKNYNNRLKQIENLYNNNVFAEDGLRENYISAYIAEEELYKEVDEMLIRLVKIRGHLWT